MPHNNTRRFLKVSTEPSPSCFHQTLSAQVLYAITRRPKNGQPTIKWTHLTATLQTKFNCQINHVDHNKYKVIPPAPGDPKWPFPQGTIHIYKPQNGTCNAQEISRLRRVFHDVFGWSPDTFNK
ncbi:hypothetical protein L226DRAFT_574656 [Lentinus tigrinus ALCF2SS1-7]|uniref:Uncharacterized protein n=1 Tax=Lentinus tigrinus ALCF2SS1-6 TaxID=1328759 RepID=A0A5C2RR44_9APHY|nr:hypothetical protein L227DRAFT_616766 [Lentinus tigrinus ALCF2SS1-6]RPD70549.1 hypothetical protein L226DRAFT_574656 [Lentinus tigrinus ALCF2SS1-7]